MIWIFALLGLFSAVPMGFVMNRMPAKCFCDYDEVPDARHAAPRVSLFQTIFCGILLAVIFGFLCDRFGVGLQSIFLCLFSVCLMMITLADLRFCIIPDELIVAAGLCAFVSAVPTVLAGGTLMERLVPLLGALWGAAIIFLINFVGQLLYKKEALGMGDLKLMAVCGLACGDTGIVMAVMVGFFAAALFFIFGILLKKIRPEQYLPLGPFLVFGVLFTCCLRPVLDALLLWYLSLI